MTDLPDVQPTETLTRDDLIEVLTGLAPGWYKTRDLHPRYAAWAASKGRSVVAIKTLGECIHRHLRPEKAGSRGNVSKWYITPELLAGRNWFVDPSVSTS